jgi:hypothetical protein
MAVEFAATAEDEGHDEPGDGILGTVQSVTNLLDHRIHENKFSVEQPSMTVFHRHATMKTHAMFVKIGFESRTNSKPLRFFLELHASLYGLMEDLGHFVIGNIHVGLWDVNGKFR